MPSELLNIEKAEEVVEIDVSDSTEQEVLPELHEYDVETNSEGRWELELDNTFEKGLHTVKVQDEAGNEVITSLFAIEPDVNVYESSNDVSMGFVYFGLFFLLILLVVSVYNFVKSLKTEKKTRTKSIKNYAKISMVFSSLVILFVVSVFGYFTYKANLVSKVSPTNLEETELEETVMVVASGSVLNPVSMDPVEGLDLSLGNQSIHTSSSGRFNFNAVTGDLVMKINHPELKRAVKYFVTEDFTQDLYFDLAMVNFLNDLLNFEAKGDTKKIYDLVYLPLKEKIEFEKFMKKYEYLYEENNLADQFIKIASVDTVKDWESQISDEKYKRVYVVKLVANGKSKNLNLVNNEGWFLVE